MKILQLILIGGLLFGLSSNGIAQEKNSKKETARLGSLVTDFEAKGEIERKPKKEKKDKKEKPEKDIATTPTDANLVAKEVKYRRSSLHLILLESENFPKKEVVMKSYNDAPFPDKYDHIGIDIKSFNPTTYSLTDAERQTAGVKTGLMGGLAASAAASASKDVAEMDAAQIPFVIKKVVDEKKIANQIVAKWFNQKADGSFDMKLIGDRGSYNASEMEANIAKGSARGVSALSDAGEELIGNTFVVFNKIKFVANEPIAAAVRDVAKLQAQKLTGFGVQIAELAADAVYSKTKEGYSVWTTSYLYKLKWNDSIAAVFYDKYWMDAKHINAKKRDAFKKADEFSLDFIGSEKSSTLVTFKLKAANRPEEEVIQLATVRNTDKVFAKLQKEYDVFKPKTPLYSGQPLTAKIGLKEGIKGGDRFEVLEQVQDEKTGLTQYVRKGIITVDKKAIWDNRFNAGDDTEKTNEGSATLDKTTFKGAKNYYAGMLIRQIK